MLILRKNLVTVDIFYYIPEYTILQEFIWQTDDVVPDIPRVHKFLNYWKNNIDSVIHEIFLSYGGGPKIKNIDLQVSYANISKLPN